jgi:glucan phosphoethanolaminetransferase (alkaline phosphatase superfamily)
MKTTYRILGMLWMAICCYFFISLSLATYHTITAASYRPGDLAILFSFVLLYLTGTVAGFHVFRGSRWGRMIVGVVALLTVMASVMGFFAFFNSSPYSVVGITFDVFAFVSAGLLLLNSRLYWILLVVVMTPGSALGAEDSPASAETERAVRQLFEIVTKPVPPKLHIVARIEITSPGWSSRERHERY